MKQIDPAGLDALIEAQNDPEPFSGVVYFSRGDDVLYARGFGDANRAEGIPNKVDTRFQMASGCKGFTGVAICRLVQDGRLALDTPLGECVDLTLPSGAADVTIRQLLTHSSGIRSYFEEDVNPDYEVLWRTLPMYRVREPADFLPLFSGRIDFESGDRFSYNDGGYVLLGLAVEAASGVGFADYVQDVVLGPSGMVDSGYFFMDQLPERTACAYIQNPDGTWRTNIYAVPIVGGGDGGAWTTAPDMARFWRALRGEKLLGAEMTAELLSAQIATTQDPPSAHYGYGVWIDRPDRVHKLFVHGSDPGVAMRSAVYPGHDVVLTVLGNTERALWPLYRDLEAILGL